MMQIEHDNDISVLSMIPIALYSTGTMIVNKYGDLVIHLYTGGLIQIFNGTCTLEWCLFANHCGLLNKEIP